MIFLHEIHEIIGGRPADFEAALQSQWRPLIEADGRARLLWYWHLTHGTGPSYQAVSISAVRDWGAWGELVARAASDARWKEWQRRAWTLRRELTTKLLLPTSWSPLAVDLSVETPAREVETPGLSLPATGWPFSGKLDEYVEALGSIFYPQTKNARMISVSACWTVA